MHVVRVLWDKAEAKAEGAHSHTRRCYGVAQEMLGLFQGQPRVDCSIFKQWPWVSSLQLHSSDLLSPLLPIVINLWLAGHGLLNS